MRKIIGFCMMFAVILLAASCSSYDTPSKAMDQYLNSLKDGNYEKFVDGMFFNEDISEEDVQKTKEQFVSLLNDKVTQENEKRGGLKDVQVLSEEISEDGTTAVVTYKMIYGDGEEKEDRQAMINKDGKWFMDMKK